MSLRSTWLLVVAIVLVGWGAGEMLTGDVWGVPIAAVGLGYLWWRGATRRRQS